MKQKNLELKKEPRFFFFEQARLSMREYKVIFCFTAISVMFIVLLWLGLDLTKWQNTTLALAGLIWAIIAGCVVSLIPIMVVLRIILGVLLKKNIKKLKEAIRQREKMSQEQ